MAAPRKWTDEQIAKTLEVYEQDGLAQAVKVCDMPKGTIASLAHRNGLQTFALPNMQEAIAHKQARRALTLEEIKDNWGEVALHMQRRAQEEVEAKDAYSATLSGAIATDKLLLMSGEATSRHETRGDLDRYIMARLAEIERGKKREAEAEYRTISKADAIEAESRSA